MRTMVARTLSVALAAALLVTGCVGPNGQTGGQTGVQTFGRGLAYLVLSPFMIVGGILQGLAFLPYTIGTGLAELNKGLVQAQAVPLDDSYKATFGVSMTDQRVNQQSGEISGQEGLYGRYRPQAIMEANRSFQRLLVSQGMPEDKSHNYVLAGNYNYAWSRGVILLAVTYRQSGAQPIRVASKETGIVTTFRPDQRTWHEPYERDVNGQVIDEVIDYKLLRQDKIVATMMVIAAEAVKSGKRSTDYWEAERRWKAGETAQLMRESLARVKIEGVN
jgi:hypothetical protein